MEWDPPWLESWTWTSTSWSLSRTYLDSESEPSGGGWIESQWKKTWHHRVRYAQVTVWFLLLSFSTKVTANRMEVVAVAVAAARILGVDSSVFWALNPMTSYGIQYDVRRRSRPSFLSWSMIYFICWKHVVIWFLCLLLVKSVPWECRCICGSQDFGLASSLLIGSQQRAKCLPPYVNKSDNSIPHGLFPVLVLFTTLIDRSSVLDSTPIDCYCC